MTLSQQELKNIEEKTSHLLKKAGKYIIDSWQKIRVSYKDVRKVENLKLKTNRQVLVFSNSGILAIIKKIFNESVK